MPEKSQGLYLFTRHSADCKYHTDHGETDRTPNRRCKCRKYIAGTAPDGAKLRQSANTTSWERARKLLLLILAEHDPLQPLCETTNAQAAEQQPQPPPRTLAEAVRQFLATKRGENVIDMAHYAGFFERELLSWCHEQGISRLRDLDLETVTKFRNALNNRGTVKNRKLSRLRSFFQFCRQRGWLDDNPAEFVKPSQEQQPSRNTSSRRNSASSWILATSRTAGNGDTTTNIEPTDCEPSCCSHAGWVWPRWMSCASDGPGYRRTGAGYGV